MVECTCPGKPGLAAPTAHPTAVQMAARQDESMREQQMCGHRGTFTAYRRVGWDFGEQSQACYLSSGTIYRYVVGAIMRRLCNI